MQIFGTGFSDELPHGLKASGWQRLFAPPGLPLALAFEQRGVRPLPALPAALEPGDAVLLPGGPEPDDPWLQEGLRLGAEVHWATPLALACGLPPGTASRHAERTDPWPAAQGVALYGGAAPRLPDALAAIQRGVLIGRGRRREGNLGELRADLQPGEVLYAPPFGGAAALELAAAAEVMRILRAPGGCPWDREQTPRSLLPYLLEEAAEVYDAILEDDLHGIVEELGDLLLQVLFHAQLGSEEGSFGLAEVGEGLWRKLVRRHPHVFGDEHYASAQDFLPRWEQLKAEEGTSRESELDGIPASLSSLAALEKAMRKLMRSGIEQFGEGGYAALFAERVAAGEDLEAEARKALIALKARCRRAETMLGVRLSRARPDEARRAWQLAQTAQVLGEERRNGWSIDES